MTLSATIIHIHDVRYLEGFLMPGNHLIPENEARDLLQYVKRYPGVTRENLLEDHVLRYPREFYAINLSAYDKTDELIRQAAIIIALPILNNKTQDKQRAFIENTGLDLFHCSQKGKSIERVECVSKYATRLWAELPI